MTPRKPMPIAKRPAHPRQPSVREVSAGGLVYKRTARGVVFAMMRDSYGKWTFPKGHVERGESRKEAAARETVEELGLKDLRLCRPLGQIDIWFRDRFVKKGALIHKDIHYFLFETPSGATLHPQASEGVMEAKWVPVGDVEEISFYRDLKPIIRRVLSQMRRPPAKKPSPSSHAPAANRPKNAASPS